MLVVGRQEQEMILREPLQNDTCVSRRVFFLREPIHQNYCSSEAAERLYYLRVARANHHKGIKSQARIMLADGEHTTRQVHTLLGVVGILRL